MQKIRGGWGGGGWASRIKITHIIILSSPGDTICEVIYPGTALLAAMEDCGWDHMGPGLLLPASAGVTQTDREDKKSIQANLQHLAPFSVARKSW